MDFFDYLSELRAELEQAKGLGLFKKVNIDRCIELLALLEDSFPTAMKEAAVIVDSSRSILENSDTSARTLLNEADSKAKEIIAGASYKADEILSETIAKAKTLSIEIDSLHSVDEKAQAMYQNAREKSEQVKQATSKHLHTVFGDLEEFLKNTAEMISNNKKEIDSALGITEKNSK